MLNAADKTFLKEMIPHHRMAVKMASTVIANGADIRVNALAQKISAGQTKEITDMETWLKEIGEMPMKPMRGM